MKINTKKSIILMGRDETKTWEAGTPESYDLRHSIVASARKLSARTGRDVEIYAAAERGGWVAEIVECEQGRGV